MTLADRFAEAPVPQGPAPRRVRSAAMKGFEPGVRVEGSGQIVTTSDVVSVLPDEEHWRAAVEDMGVVVPPGWTVRLVEMRYDPAAWTRDDSSQEKAVTKPVYRYRFKVEPAGPASADIEDLIALVENAGPPAPTAARGDDPAFVVAIGDTQFGKVDGDGLEGTIKRVLESTERAVARLETLRDQGHSPQVVYICWLGDCIEGFVSQGGGNAWRTPTTLTEQVRIARRLMLHMIDQFRELAPQVVLLSIPGNHDESVRSNTGKVTRYDDSWAIEAAVAVSDAMELNPEAYGHCGVKVPGRDELTLTVDMAGTIVGLAHGHQMRAGKQHEWWASQAHGLQPIGEATLLLTAHFHHLVVEQPGAKTWIQVPAMEHSSVWWRHLKGQVSPPGMVTMLVGSGAGVSGWSDLQVV